MVGGDGDRHMRGMSCLLTGIELFPGNIQGGSDTPAGWAKGISIDQEIKKHLQSHEATRTRFGSLEFGVGVSDRADPWTRMSYAGPNLPVAPTDDPYRMYRKLYGQLRGKQSVLGIIDQVKEDLKKVSQKVSPEDRQILDEHATLIREMEREFAEGKGRSHTSTPALESGIANQNDNLPTLGRMQIELLVNSFVKRLSETPEPGGEGTLLDNTIVVWTNELGKGNNHTLNDIPFTLVGGGLNFKMGRSLNLNGVAHNRLHLALAHGFGHHLETFGNPKLSQGGPLDLS